MSSTPSPPPIGSSATSASPPSLPSLLAPLDSGDLAAWWPRLTCPARWCGEAHTVGLRSDHDAGV
jgi:hypothetical protein